MRKYATLVDMRNLRHVSQIRIAELDVPIFVYSHVQKKRNALIPFAVVRVYMKNVVPEMYAINRKGKCVVIQLVVSVVRRREMVVLYVTKIFVSFLLHDRRPMVKNVDRKILCAVMVNIVVIQVAVFVHPSVVLAPSSSAIRKKGFAVKHISIW